MALKLLRFLNRETAGAKPRVLMTSLISGLSRGLLLTTINAAAAAGADGRFDPLLVLEFLVILSVYLATSYDAILQGQGLIEAMAQRLRLRISEKLLLGQLRFIETWGSGEIYTQVTQDISRLSSAAMTFINGFQATVLMTFALAYLGWLTPLGLLAAVVAIGAGMITYFWQDQSATRDLEQARAKEAEFFQGIDDLLRGFKEMKQSRARRIDLLAHLEAVSGDYRQLTVKAESKFLFTTLTSQSFMFVLVAVLVFALPAFIHGDRTVIFQFLATILFVIGPLETLVSSIPSISKASVALKNVQRLERELDAGIAAEATGGGPLPAVGFQRIVLQGVHFSFVGGSVEESFDVGPVDLEIRRGEVLFIVGGNGAGKTTLLKLLTGLYPPDSGQVLVDDLPLLPPAYQAYREIFAAVFGDFHLFRRLYGIAMPDPAPLDRLLEKLQIGQKTRLVDGVFTTTQLSAGQRKRLAYAVARLADRQIYVFDEFAADQDPGFRRFFYRELVPELKRQGKTVVAVTHDDRWFEVADRVVKMDYGRIVEASARSSFEPVVN